MDTWVRKMKYMIKELRAAAEMTQKEFADLYGIPLSTLRKWEQGETSPAPYVLQLLARSLPSTDKTLQKIQGTDGAVYYYDKYKKMVEDTKGNCIQVQEELDEVKTQNLGIYLRDLFEAFYEIQEKFNRDCRYDKEEDIIWKSWEE